MMRAKPHKEDHSVNIVTRSGVATGEEKGKQPQAKCWVHKATKKEVYFDLNKTKDTFMEENKSFTKASVVAMFGFGKLVFKKYILRKCKVRIWTKNIKRQKKLGIF